MNLSIRNLEKVIKDNNLGKKVEIDYEKKLVLVIYYNDIEAIPFCYIAGSSVYRKDQLVKIHLTTAPNNIEIPIKYNQLQKAV